MKTPPSYTSLESCGSWRFNHIAQNTDHLTCQSSEFWWRSWTDFLDDPRLCHNHHNNYDHHVQVWLERCKHHICWPLSAMRGEIFNLFKNMFEPNIKYLKRMVLQHTILCLIYPLSNIYSEKLGAEQKYSRSWRHKRIIFSDETHFKMKLRSIYILSDKYFPSSIVWAYRWKTLLQWLFIIRFFIWDWNVPTNHAIILNF